MIKLVTTPPDQSLSLEEMIHQHKYRIQRYTKSKKQILLEKQYRLFTYLQEPRNRYEIVLQMGSSYQKLDVSLSNLEKIGLISMVEYNPNKYKTTAKGLLVIHLIKELNKLMPYYSKLKE